MIPRMSTCFVLASMLALQSVAGVAPAAAEPYTLDRSWQAAFLSGTLASNGSLENEKVDWCCDSHGNRSGTGSATINGPRTAAEATKFRWRWEKILGPGDHPWTTTWRSSQSGPFCDHAGEGKFCGCSKTSACGQYDSGQEIATAPFGCDRPERWRLRCITEPDSR